MDNYKNLLTSVGIALKSRGFVKKADTFFIFKNDNWGLINFQKSRSSSKNKIAFTINIGVCSTAIRKILNHGNIGDRPIIDECHWKKRVGFLMPLKQDHWWHIDNDESIESLIGEIILLLDKSITPELENHLSDETLEKEWLDQVADGITELQRYIFLTILLKLKKDEKLPVLIEELKAFAQGKSYESTVEEHTKKLEINV